MNMKILVAAQSQKGFTLIEVMMALVILGVGIMSIMALQTQNMNLNSSSKRQTEAYTLAMDQVESLLSIAYTNPLLDVQGVPATLNDGHPAVQGPYTLEWDVADNNAAIPNSKRVHMSVRWNNREVAAVDFVRTQTSF